MTDEQDIAKAFVRLMAENDTFIKERAHLLTCSIAEYTEWVVENGDGEEPVTDSGV